MAPTGVMDGLLVGRNDFRALNEVLTRSGFPPARQDLIRLPELGAGGTGGLGLSRLTATEADHCIRFTAIRVTPLVVPDTTRPTGLGREAIVGPGFRSSPAQPLLSDKSSGRALIQRASASIWRSSFGSDLLRGTSPVLRWGHGSNGPGLSSA